MTPWSSIHGQEGLIAFVNVLLAREQVETDRISKYVLEIKDVLEF